ncbi:MAG: exosortase H [Acidobacteriota bacterium]
MSKSSKKSKSPDNSPAAKPSSEGTSEPESNDASIWQTYRQEITFLLIFILILGGGFTFLSFKPVNDNVVEPFTGGVAKVSGSVLNLIGQDISMEGTIVRNNRFAVNIRNGCNGVETMIIFLAAVLAFPASWKARGVGLALGLIAIQVVNLIRVVALFLTGVYFPKFFDSSHTVVWQTIVILFGVLLWIFWANRFASLTPAEAAEATAE